MHPRKKASSKKKGGGGKDEGWGAAEPRQVEEPQGRRLCRGRVLHIWPPEVQRLVVARPQGGGVHHDEACKIGHPHSTITGLLRVRNWRSKVRKSLKSPKSQEKSRIEGPKSGKVRIRLLLGGG